MKTQANSPKEQVALYQQRAQLLRQMAKDEPLGKMRDKILTLAWQCECLVESLKADAGH